MADRFLQYRNALVMVPLAVAIALLPFFTESNYLLSVMIFIALHTILTVGLALLLGYAGQVSLGQAGFYGLGAYISGILTSKYGVNAWLALVLAAIATAAFAYIVGRQILQLKGNYLAMATLALGIIVYVAFAELDFLTGGPSGLLGIPHLSIGSFRFNTDFRFYYLIWAITLVVLAVSLNIVNSRTGRAMRALHTAETAAETLGVDTATVKVQVFALSALYASIAGSLYVHYVVFVNPSPFDFGFSVELVVMAVVGGLASVWGALFGAAAITVLVQAIQSLMHSLTGRGGEVEIIAFGLILILVMVFMPEGLTRGVINAFNRLRLERAAPKIKAVGYTEAPRVQPSKEL